MTDTSPGSPAYTPPNELEKLREAVQRDMNVVMDLMERNKYLEGQMKDLKKVFADLWFSAWVVCRQHDEPILLRDAIAKLREAVERMDKLGELL